MQAEQEEERLCCEGGLGVWVEVHPSSGNEEWWGMEWGVVERYPGRGISFEMQMNKMIIN